LKNTKIREEGSSATDFVTDVTDVTPGSQKEEGRRKKQNYSQGPRPHAPCPMPHASATLSTGVPCPIPSLLLSLSPPLPRRYSAIGKGLFIHSSCCTYVAASRCIDVMRQDLE